MGGGAQSSEKCTSSWIGVSSMLRSVSTSGVSLLPPSGGENDDFSIWICRQLAGFSLMFSWRICSVACYNGSRHNLLCSPANLCTGRHLLLLVLGSSASTPPANSNTHESQSGEKVYEDRFPEKLHPETAHQHKHALLITSFITMSLHRKLQPEDKSSSMHCM